jgi:HK97 family phage major capsid protein
MKKRLLELLEKRKAKKTELLTKADATEDIEEIKGFRTDMDALDAEIRDLEAMITDLPDDEGIEGRSMKVDGARVLGTYGMEGGKPADKSDERDVEDPYGTLEYRKAFKDYVLSGKKSDVLTRSDATTASSDIGAVIPTNILNKVVESMTDFGRIYSRVGKSNVAAGLQIPLATVKPTASWVAEGSVADKQKKTISGSISFSYFKLQVRVAETLVANTVSLSVFESTITSNINEAMVVGIETAIISGTGSGQPMGIVNDTNIAAGRKISVDVADLGNYQKWTELMAKIPRKYRNGAVLILNDLDWNKYIVGMVDANGQPVARTTYGLEGIQNDRFLGKEVIAVEDYLTSIDAATSGDVFGILVRLKDYLFNSNMTQTFRRYFDENTDEWVSKSTLIADGKLADPNGVVLLKKK